MQLTGPGNWGPPADESGARAVLRRAVELGVQCAQTVVEIATVQNIYNLANRAHTDVLEYCERNGIGFVPFWPLHGGVLARSPAMAEIVSRTRSTPAKVALAWLLRKSPAVILIPGTSSLEHLEENVSAYDVPLSADDMTRLEVLTIGSLR
jgi:pyridoxine 4-dehydrogenase